MCMVCEPGLIKGRIYTSMVAESHFLDVYIRPWHWAVKAK